MKPVNIFDLSQIEDYQIFKEYSSVLRGSKKNPPKDSDQEALIGLVRNLNAGYKDLNDFYFSYSIPQISKEFDLIKIEVENSSSNEIKGIINIELKSGNKGEEKIKEQLIQNQYYLGHISKNISSFTYVVETNKVYVLEKDVFKETTFKHLSDRIKSMNYCYSDDINLLFKPTQYLVSPVNNPRQFLNGEYFLNGHQCEIRKEIISLVDKRRHCFLDVSGKAGTGKTLLMYDIAKYYSDMKKKVLIIFCGQLPDVSSLAEEMGVDIEPIKEIKEKYKEILQGYDLILVDETQRIYKHQLEIIKKQVSENDILCIFFHDGEQIFTNEEENRRNCEKIKEISGRSFELSEKVRTNKNLASFIKNMFDLGKRNAGANYDCVNVIYSKNNTDAKNVLKHFRSRGYEFINFTASNHKETPFDCFIGMTHRNTHNVIGQEYDNVIIVLNKVFKYDEQGKLLGEEHVAHYLYRNLLFQAVTRAREKLVIVVVENQQLFSKINMIKYNNLA